MDNMDVPQIVMVDRSLLKKSALNPKKRVASQVLGDLLDSMRRHGFLANHPISITKDYEVGDGHRRLRCAEILEIDNIPAIISDKSVGELMAENAGSKPWRLGDWPDSVEHPKSARDYEENLTKLAGENAITFVREQGKSPRIADVLRRVLVYIDVFDDISYGEKTLKWLCVHGMVRYVSDAMRDSIDPEIIVEAINYNKPLMRGRWYA